jgi:hypothetical protein
MAKRTVIDLPKAASILAAAHGAGIDVSRIVNAIIEVVTGEQQSFTDEISEEFSGLVDRFMNAPMGFSFRVLAFYAGTRYAFKIAAKAIPKGMPKGMPIGGFYLKFVG